MKRPEFIFELHACRWAELSWPPDGSQTDNAIIVGRQVGTRRRRWDTVILECDPAGLHQRERFGADRLDSDLLHVITNAPAEWTWYRDALPSPEYPWRYVRESVHRANDRDILDVRKRRGRIEIRRRWVYPKWVKRIISIEHKPDLDASAAATLSPQLEFDVAYSLADEIWLGTRTTDASIPPALFEAIPVEVGILTIDPETLSGSVVWHPRSLGSADWGTRILERPRGGPLDQSAASIEFVTPAEKENIRLVIAERIYERGWRGVLESMRPDCRHFLLAEQSLTHEPQCRAKGRAQTSTECSGSCPLFEPEPPTWRMGGWPIEGGPGRGLRRVYTKQRARYR